MKQPQIILGTLCVGLVLLLSGCASEKPNTITMTVTQLMNDQTIKNEGTTETVDYKSIQDGDTIIIQDVLTRVSYDIAQNYTILGFNYTTTATGEQMLFFFIKGNVATQYAVGDTVKLTLTIKHVTFTSTGTTYDIETFKEMYDQTDYLTSNFNPAIPASLLSKA